MYHKLWQHAHYSDIYTPERYGARRITANKWHGVKRFVPQRQVKHLGIFVFVFLSRKLAHWHIKCVWKICKYPYNSVLTSIIYHGCFIFEKIDISSKNVSIFDNNMMNGTLWGVFCHIHLARSFIRHSYIILNHISVETISIIKINRDILLSNVYKLTNPASGESVWSWRRLYQRIRMTPVDMIVKRPNHPTQFVNSSWHTLATIVTTNLWRNFNCWMRVHNALVAMFHWFCRMLDYGAHRK